MLTGPLRSNASLWHLHPDLSTRHGCVDEDGLASTAPGSARLPTW
jgi:hypothetical protein